MATLGANAQIYSYTFSASGTPGGGNPQSSAEATFTFNDSTHTETIVIQNLQTGNGFSSQAISGLSFDDGISGTSVYEGGTGQLIDIAANGTYTFGSDSQNDLTHWDFSGSGGLTTLTSAKPNQMIIAGPGGSTYTLNGNGNGFSQFDDYTYLSGTFVVSNADIKAGTTLSLSDVRFAFGTGPDGYLCGTPGAPVPESSTVVAGLLMLLPLGIGTIRALRKERIPAKIS